LADAIAAALVEIFLTRGQKVRYHHLGPIGPAACWDRWEGSSFLDPALYPGEALLGLYEAAVRGADLSLLSSNLGVLDSGQDVSWSPCDIARSLDCPVLAVVDCRNWGKSIRLVSAGLRVHLSGVNLAGVILTGVADQRHLDLLRPVFNAEDLLVVGCLFAGDGPDWDATPPGAWGLPLHSALLDAVSRQVDLRGVVLLAGQRGFLPSQSWLVDRGVGGPLLAVASGKGFSVWSRDSIEALRSAGAQVRRLDLLEDEVLPDGVSGLVMAGTAWPGAFADIAMNTTLLASVCRAVRTGMPTLALGGGALLLFDKVQDLLGRTSDMAGVVPAQAEILWELEEPVRLELIARRGGALFSEGDTVPGWLLTDAEVTDLTGQLGSLQPAFTARGIGGADVGGSCGEGRLDGMATDTLLCSTALLHLAGKPGMASRFVRSCAAYASRRG
jgi:cobyrinic acid a,c-diamide synthase